MCLYAEATVQSVKYFNNLHVRFPLFFIILCLFQFWKKKKKDYKHKIKLLAMGSLVIKTEIYYFFMLFVWSHFTYLIFQYLEKYSFHQME